LKKTLFDKIWDSHVIRAIDGGPSVLFIDRHYIHEVTSPQAFEGLRGRGLKVLMPARTVATADHNIPTRDQHLPIRDALSRVQVQKLTKNCSDFGIELYGLGHPYNGIVHVIGPELGFTQSGMTIVCGDSHTSTHGAFGSVAFGIGTSEVEMVLASQCVMQTRPRTMRITVDGELNRGVVAKDIILYIISKLTADGGTGYFVEFAGSAIRSLSMEGRMTVCNMSIEMGARGGLIAPDEKTFDYIKGRRYAPKGAEFSRAVERWGDLYSDPGAVFNREHLFKARDINPMITYGTNPGLGMAIDGTIPLMNDFDPATRESFRRSLNYMELEPGASLLGRRIDYVFVGSCTNGRIEDLRLFTQYVRGRKKAPGVTAWIVPGSKQVEQQAEAEGLTAILKSAGFEMRRPGCSACLAMNEDKIPAGSLAVSTSNRNFEGRQGPGARTLLAGPHIAAAAAVTGRITDPRDILPD
jgi:3-isopropylmalate/(R)-2-methylmalate dehydratase large subunit